MLKYLQISLVIVMSIIILNKPESKVATVTPPIVKSETLVILPEVEPPKVVFLEPRVKDLTKEAKKTIQCLAGNIYFEARNEPLKGQIAVAFVTLNRVNSKDFPDDVCNVVKQKKGRTCQFSWYCENKPKRQYYKMHLTDKTNQVYNEIVRLALFVYANHEKLKDPTHGSLYYHADYVSPNWRHLVKTTKIGAHIFYTTREI